MGGLISAGCEIDFAPCVGDDPVPRQREPLGGAREQEGRMLVLTQKEGEVLQVGPDVRILIKRVKGNWVRLCIEAPRDVVLQRHAAPEPEVVYQR